MIWALLIWLLQPVTLPDTPIAITLSANDGPLDVQYSGTSDEIIDVAAHSLSDEPIDVTLEILLDEQRIAFNDDHDTGVQGLNPQDAAITNLRLPADGDYTLRVHTFSGAQSGEVEIRLTANPAVAPCDPPEQVVTLQPHTAYPCLINLQADQTVTLTARDISGTLDPVLRLDQPDGTLAVQNDDHDSSSLTLNTLDAQAVYTVPADGAYHLTVRDFAGQTGQLAVTIEIES